jgi:hypothetical protein
MHMHMGVRPRRNQDCALQIHTPIAVKARINRSDICYHIIPAATVGEQRTAIFPTPIATDSSCSPVTAEDDCHFGHRTHAFSFMTNQLHFVFLGRWETYRLGGLTPYSWGGHGNEVKMVRHQAQGPDGDVIGTAPLRHQLDIGEVIVVAKKGLLTTITPLGDMVWVARDYYSCNSC